MQSEDRDQIDDFPEENVGVYISGLFMDGARWDRDAQVITDQLPAKMQETMPVVWFIPKEDYKVDPEEYQAPLYKTS
jgi:dynein heavy chain